MCTYAEETFVVGTVVNESTGEPIENAHIYFRGTEIGTTSNPDGAFALHIDMKEMATLFVSAVGYHKEKFKVTPGQYVGIPVELKEKTATIEEVMIVPGSNPALPILEQVRIHRTENDYTLRQGTTLLEEKQSLFLSDIQRKHLQRTIWRGLQSGIIQQEDSSLLFPLYFKTQNCFLEGSEKTYASDKEETLSLLTETSYDPLLTFLNNTINFYPNTLTFGTATFLSPLATSGSSYYKYYLVDSLRTDSGTTYIIDFKTKSPFMATFNGQMQIDSSTYALRGIQASVPREANVNYLTSLHISQTFSAHGTLEDESISLIFDFAVKTDSSHIFPAVLAQRHSHIKQTTMIASGNQLTDSSVFFALDSLKRKPIIRFANWLAYLLNTGYVSLGDKSPIDIGKLVEVVFLSPHEGWHLGLPFRTNEKLWKNVSIEGYAAYGFKDHGWKWKAQISWQLPTKNRHILTLNAWDHYIYSETSDFERMAYENSIGYGFGDITTLLFGNIFYNQDLAKLSARRKREARLTWDGEWNPNIETRFDFSCGRNTYSEPGYYHQGDAYTFLTGQATFRLSFDQRKVDLFFKRVYMPSRYPVVYLNLEGGGYRLKESDPFSPYGGIHIALHHEVNLGICGTLDYLIRGGWIFGNMPYTMLNVIEGNQGTTFDGYRFTLMNQFQYATDRYILFHAHWNMNGLLFNLIPGIRYLHLRELIEFKVAYGGLREGHKSVIDYPYDIKALTTPYVELGVGIGNILRIGELYSVWRLTNMSDLSTPIWSMRFRIKIGT